MIFFECKGKSELREALKSVYEKLYDKKVIEEEIEKLKQKKSIS